MTNLNEIFQNFLEKNLFNTKSFHPTFNDALNYMIKGGKHFRAQLLLGVVEALNPAMLQKALDVALAIEIFHTYSLIHDDLPAMDNADLRRGIPSVHKKFDETTAILVGDALNTHAFYLIANSNLQDEIKVKCVKILSQNGGIGGMVLGQALDCYFEKQKLNFEDLKFLHIHKTGALIASCMQLGGLIATNDDSFNLYEIGLKLGLAFQVNDDIIDATFTQKEAGKPVRNDTDKNSYTNLLGVEKAKEFLENLKQEIKSQKIDEKLQILISNLIEKYLKG